jgi:hypothetical protein
MTTQPTDIKMRFNIKDNEFYPTVQSFHIIEQTKPCPPQIINMLVHNISNEILRTKDLKEFDLVYKTCHAHVSINLTD